MKKTNKYMKKKRILRDDCDLDIYSYMLAVLSSNNNKKKSLGKLEKEIVWCIELVQLLMIHNNPSVFKLPQMSS